MKITCSTLLVTLLLLAGCSENQPKTGGMEVYEYYPDGTVKSIGNYIDGKQKRRSPGFRIVEAHTIYEVAGLLDSIGILRLMTPGQSNGYGAGLVTPENKRQIEQILSKQSSSELLKDLRFAWSDSPENINGQSLYSFYVLKPESLMEVLVTNKDIAKVEKTMDERLGQNMLNVTFTQKGKAKFAQLTSDNVGKTLTIMLDNQVLSAPMVNEVITGGQVVIAGNFTEQQVTDLEQVMNHSILNGEYREYHPNGKLKTIMTFENGEQAGAYSRYDQNGKLIKKYGE